MKTHRMAVIGVGSLGQHHASKLAGFDDVDLVAVVDPGAEQVQAVASKNNTQAMTSIFELPDNLDGVVIATPTIYHLESARHFLKQGIPTFVEKPLAVNVDEAQQLLDIASQGNAMLQVGHIERFNPAFQLAADRVGKPLYIRAQRVSPYTFRSTDIGVVHDLMIHDIDLALALTQETPVSVDAFGAVGIGPKEDMAVARFKMPSGCVVDITSSRMAPVPERTLQVWSDTGCVSANLHTREVTSWKASNPFQANPGMVHSIAAATPDPRTLKDSVFGKWIETETIEGNSCDQMSLELRDFIDSITNGTQPAVTGQEALKAMQVAEQVVDSLELWSYQTQGHKSADKKAA